MLSNRARFTIISAILLFLSAYGLASADAPLRIAYPIFKPFHYIDGKGELTGLFHDIISETVNKRLGKEIIWTPYPWSRCQTNVKYGKDDAILTVPTVERAIYTRTHDKPFYEKKLHIYTYNNHPRLEEIYRIQSIDDIKKAGFSVITYQGNGWHKTNIESKGITSYNSTNLVNVWKMLASKRGDRVIEWPTAALPDLQKLELEEQIVDTNIILAKMSFHLLIQKDSPHVEILNRFDEVLTEMEKAGTLSIIDKRYEQE
mgnify:CR=1 FL=1